MLKRIREMKYSDLAFAEECTRTVGRISETVEELESLLMYDAKGCFVAEHGQRRVGFCIATCYGKCSFLSVLAERETDSEADVERELLDHAVRYLLSCGSESIFAEAGQSSVSLFDGEGFAKLCRTLRFVACAYARSHQNVRAVWSQDLSTIDGVDRHSFRANRRFFLERRLSLTPQFCKVLEMNGRIGGYIMARRGRGAVAVGPWVVLSNVDCPADLLEGLAVEAMGERLLIEVLETNDAAVGLLRAMGFIESPDPTWRMIHGRWSNVGLSKSLYAIGSPFTG
jgi:ribosomal protein S18 acetylase RimI-like enzyme